MNAGKAFAGTDVAIYIAGTTVAMAMVCGGLAGLVKENSRTARVERAGRELLYEVRFNDSSVFYKRPCRTVDFAAGKAEVFFNPRDLI